MDGLLDFLIENEAGEAQAPIMAATWRDAEAQLPPGHRITGWGRGTATVPVTKTLEERNAWRVSRGLPPILDEPVVCTEFRYRDGETTTVRKWSEPHPSVSE